MSGSGKQILLHVLTKLSTTLLSENALQDATRYLRAGLLFHGSTSEESVRFVKQLHWHSLSSGGELVRQCIVAGHGNFPIADIFETICEMPGLKVHLRTEYAGLKDREIDAALWAIWLIVSSVQMFAELREIEVSSNSETFEMMISKMADIYEKMSGEID